MCPKGKVNPYMSQRDLLKILPEAIITLSIALPSEDQEVLFYLIGRSLNLFSLYKNEGKNYSKRGRKCIGHRLSFDCSCFECYMSFWGRWNDSPNHELIHEAINLFEDHMAGIESNNKMGKNRKKMKFREEKIAKQVVWAKDNCNINREMFAEEKHLSQKSKSNQVVPFGSDRVTNLGYIDEEQKNRPQMMEKYLRSAGSERTMIRRMLPELMGFLTENLRTVWRPLDTCKV
eukprot:Gb_13151 [translate_table: standard]